MPDSVSVERGLQETQFHRSISHRICFQQTQGPIFALKPANEPKANDQYARLEKNKTEMLAHVSPATRS